MRNPRKLDNSVLRRRKERRGTAVVEFAVVAPVFLLLAFGMVEFGRMVMVEQILADASREGARLAVLDGVGGAEVAAAVEARLANASIRGATVAVAADSPLTRTVSVAVPFSQVSWLPTPKYLGNHTLRAQTTMRREAVQ
jgi:Flp pilus assembly protein TadG